MSKLSKPAGISAEDWKWEVESAADTLQRAEEIAAKPKLHAAALGLLVEREGAIEKALKKHGNPHKKKDKA